MASKDIEATDAFASNFGRKEKRRRIAIAIRTNFHIKALD